MRNSAKHCMTGVILIMFSLIMGCGYTNQAKLPNNISTIAVPTFKNMVKQSETYTYEAGLEVDITNDIINRLNYDGNLKVADSDKADATLVGAITRYEQDSIRYEDRDDVKEYRLFISVDLILQDNRSGEIIWEEKGFTGRTEYFRSGSYATSESAAAASAREDLAKNIVDRIIEDW